MNFLNSIYYKSLVALYRLNANKDGPTRSFLISAIWQALLDGNDGLNLAKLEMSLKTASGEWLDYWGNFYGVIRLYEEDDDLYRVRIIEELTEPKNTRQAIQKATLRYIKRKFPDTNMLEGEVSIFEPWTKLLKLDHRGRIDGDGRLISYEYWNYGVIDITLPDSSYISPELIDYIRKVKAAGVSIVFSISPNWEVGIDPLRNQRELFLNIDQYYYINSSINYSDCFKIQSDSPIPDGNRLDINGYLDGRITIFWEGVIREKPVIYVTDRIRNHLGSAVISFRDYYMLENKELTVEEGINLDKQSIEAKERLKEGKLTRLLGDFEITRKNLNQEHLLYISYKNGEGFTFDVDNITNYLEIEKAKNHKVYDLNKNLLEYDDNMNIVKEEVLRQIDLKQNKEMYQIEIEKKGGVDGN